MRQAWGEAMHTFEEADRKRFAYVNKVVEQVETEAFGHSFTYYLPDGNSTCVADGTKTAQCDRCDVTDTVADEGSALVRDVKKITGVTAVSLLAHDGEVTF